jgi:hypothetical protein
MKRFIYYNISDPKKEPIGKLQAINLEDAILVAAYAKQMPVDDFLNVFKVEEYERRKIQKSK